MMRRYVFVIALVMVALLPSAAFAQILNLQTMSLFTGVIGNSANGSCTSPTSDSIDCSGTADGVGGVSVNVGVSSPPVNSRGFRFLVTQADMGAGTTLTLGGDLVVSQVVLDPITTPSYVCVGAVGSVSSDFTNDYSCDVFVDVWSTGGSTLVLTIDATVPGVWALDVSSASWAIQGPAFVGNTGSLTYTDVITSALDVGNQLNVLFIGAVLAFAVRASITTVLRRILT